MTTPVPLNALPVGIFINSRYEVLSGLGSGASGVVYEVRDHNTGQISALKFLLTYSPTSPWTEAQTLIGLEGEFILPVRNADHASGVPFIVTEVARNGTATKALAPGIGLPVEQAVRWVRQACRGVARIHDTGLVHNDIKPENLFISDDGDALVGDLGLASLRDHTGHGSFGGTPSTMAPEVALIGATVPQRDWRMHRPTSIASDVYSLGATLYWLLSGNPPHHHPTNPIAAMASVVAAPPPDLLTVAPHVPRVLRDIVKTAMARNPIDRYGSASAFDTALGNRSKQRRIWTRTLPHAGHVMCFAGTGHGSDLLVCAVHIGPRTRHEIQITHASSGRRVKPWPKVTSAELPGALRRAFRQHQ